ncbi:alanine racemase [Niveispirillum cyanobacteriorum]|nr:alanine racemase [Niveispirillum cyanobacteriorum]GGE78695.1 alanine racemase [Niveispirillum cyanobacteriorum]
MPDTPAAYFASLSAALDRARIAEPVLILDRSRLDANIRAVADMSRGAAAVRLVVKSLPCAPLLRHLSASLNSNRAMVFNRAMLLSMRDVDPTSDILLGKPLPVAAARAYYDEAGIEGPGPRWLIDSVERLDQYAALARTLGIRLDAAVEVDVGLHRGGVAGPAALAGLLDRAGPEIRLTGLMGYDPHLAKLPQAMGIRSRAFAGMCRDYAAMAALLRSRGVADPLLNSAGSPTYVLHATGSPANDLAIGSAFVKPSDFDIGTLSHHVPACFIATPVLKVAHPARVPGLGSLPARLFPGQAQAHFIHGGNWLADPVWPAGLRRSAIFGPSSNQECWLGSHDPARQPGDWLFLRPRQSEALFLQFGSLTVFDGGEITQAWPVFPPSA